MADEQLPLALPFRPALGPGDFLPHAGVQMALDLVAAGKSWPQHRLVLWGGAGVGKTHLLHVWASETGASIIDGPQLREPFWPEGPISIDDADQVPSEEVLLHVLNAAAESGHRLLLTSTRPPARCRIRLADLSSRLRATMAVELGPQDDDMLAALLAKLLSDRQVVVPPPIQKWMLTRLPRTAATIREAVQRLDYAALAAQSSVSRTLAAECLADLFVNQTPQESPP